MNLLAGGLGRLPFMKSIREFLKLIALLCDRVDMLETVVYRGHEARSILVPKGMSPEVAWQHIQEGRPFDGRSSFTKVYILTDSLGNLLRVY